MLRQIGDAVGSYAGDLLYKWAVRMSCGVKPFRKSVGFGKSAIYCLYIVSIVVVVIIQVAQMLKQSSFFREVESLEIRELQW